MKLKILRFLVLMITTVAMCRTVISDLVSWSPSWLETPRDDLKCDNNPSNMLVKYCDQQSVAHDLDKCCSCRTSTTWAGQEINMIVEYISVLGKTVILTRGPSIDTSHVYKVEYENNKITDFPSNICNWDTSNRIQTSYSQQYIDIQSYWAHIVRLNFAGNRIQQVVDLNCLSNLDTLELQNNKISHLSNTSFQNLSNLRNINIANNLITIIDHSVFSSEKLGILNVDISNNLLSNVEFANLFSMHPFCKFDYKSNQIEKITNEINFTLITDGSRKYGPGMIDITNNIFQTFPNIKELLHLDTSDQLGVFIEFGFNMKGSELNCDCNLHQLEIVIETFYLDYLNITCVSPPKYKGQRAFSIPQEELVCPVGASENCPKGCECINKPEEDSLFVNCSNRGLTELPNQLPETKYSKFINLDVSYNTIHEIANVSYINKIKVLDISYNDLKFINNTIMQMFNRTNVKKNDISYNDKFHELPQMFQYLNACKVHTESLIIECDCESLWIVYWLKAKTCHHDKRIFHCRVPTKGVIYGPDFKQTHIDCKHEEGAILIIGTVLLATTAVLVIVFSVLVYYFRYEILIIWCRSRKTSMNSVVPKFTYDAFLSFDDGNEELFRWVSIKLLPYLEQAGYKLFMPERDLVVGEVRDTETIEILSKTRNFLLILSKSYFNQDGHSWIDNEWKYGWNMFKDDKSKNIVIVNYDHMSSFDVDQSQIKAFLRVGNIVEFLNRDRKLFDHVSRKLGPPYRKKKFSGQIEQQQQPVESSDMHKRDNKFELVELTEISTSAYDRSCETTISKRNHHERLCMMPARTVYQASNFVENGHNSI